MSTAQTAAAPVDPSEMRSMLRELQDETILLVLPALYAASLALFGAASSLPNPMDAIVPCLVLSLLASAVWMAHRYDYLASAWILILGSVVAIMMVAARMHVASMLTLLALPAGLAALFIGMRGGLLVATACSLLVAYSPAGLLRAGHELRVVTPIGVWGTVGLIWLTTRPLLTALEWSWSSHRQSRWLLDQARDQRMQLKQALADLADANLQLTRLNRLAQSLRQAAEEARRAKEQFVANVSHELRTPLNMVIGFSETILQAPETYGSPIPPALLADLSVILRNSQHLSALIDDVLDLSQIEAGQMALSKERVTLGQIIEEAAVAVRPLYASKGLYLQTDVAADLPPVCCDRTRIREVLLNLLSNAGRFTEYGGVTVRARQDGPDELVSVADTGPGIAARDRERLFRPFEQIDSSLRRRYGGTGLGLSISKSFVELHGGSMWLQSEVGKGTTLSFRVPIDPPVTADPRAQQWLRPGWEYEQRTRPARLSPRLVGPRLVVLETGSSLRRLLARYLGQAELVSATTVGAALQELAAAPAQALLVNEAPLCEGMRRLLPVGPLPHGTPAVICSVPGAHEAAGALGAADYLVKPIARDRLLAALDRLNLGGKTILVVDDDPEAARLFRRMLNSYDRGYRVLTTTEGKQALQTLRTQRPHALLLDLVMPDMDGFQIMAEKNGDPAICDIPVIVISAQDPAGQPIVTNSLAITRAGGLSMPQVLACVEAVSGPLWAAGQPGRPGSAAEQPG